MTETVRNLLRMFDTLSTTEQLEMTAEILRRHTSAEDLSDAALDQLAAELFRSYDAEEADRAAS
jgi:hypothetical protein